MREPVHHIAAAGFSSDAARYERARPGYPAKAVAWLVESLAIGPASSVVDLAAGTGKLTRLLTATGATVVAVEPVAAMRAELSVHCPEVTVVDATAEMLPFATASVDAVTAAQAFHWFEPLAAWAELGRVLRPGGGVGLLWNVRDRSVEWVDDLWRIMDAVEKQAPWRDHESAARHGLEDRPGFGDLHERRFRHSVAMTEQDLVDRFLSVSHVAVLSVDEQQRIVAQAVQTARGHPEAWQGDRLMMPYRVDAYWTRRQP